MYGVVVTIGTATIAATVAETVSVLFVVITDIVNITTRTISMIVLYLTKIFVVATAIIKTTLFLWTTTAVGIEQERDQ